MAIWIPVEERLPDVDCVVLVFCREANSEPPYSPALSIFYDVWLAYFDSEDGSWRYATGGTCSPSHWMEMPEPPNERIAE